MAIGISYEFCSSSNIMYLRQEMLKHSIFFRLTVVVQLVYLIREERLNASKSAVVVKAVEEIGRTTDPPLRVVRRVLVVEQLPSATPIAICGW